MEGCHCTGLSLDARSEFKVKVFMPHLALEVINIFPEVLIEKLIMLKELNLNKI